MKKRSRLARAKSWKTLIGSETDQLKDITIIIAVVDDNGVRPRDRDASAYASTRVYRYDMEGSVEDFIKKIEKLKQKSDPNRKKYPPHEYLIEGGQMGNKGSDN